LVKGFTSENVERARRYHGPLYRALALDLTLGLTVLATFALALPRGLAPGPWWLETVVVTWLVLVASALVRLPLSFWRGYVHEHRFGLSTQTVRGWLADRAKSLAVGAVVTSILMVGLVGLARAFPRWWPVAAAAAAGAFVLLLSFVAPVVLEPLFNRFRPLGDERLAGALLELSERAGVPVKRVLVADASRRTRKSNAYVSGLGRTRRVVVFDTLLERSGPGEVELVVAHELAHRRARHVAKGTAVAMTGTALGVLALWAALRWEPLLDAASAAGPGDPRAVPLVLLLGTVLELAAAPLLAALSRRFEREADRGSLDLTGDVESFERAHRRLALSNLSDLAPPRVLYLLLFTHPTPPERITAARAWAKASASDASASGGGSSRAASTISGRVSR
jgi:STE24 endopeptidase